MRSQNITQEELTLKSRGGLERRFEQGIFAYHRADYTTATKVFEKVCDGALRTDKHELFVESCTYLIRLLAEHEDFDKIDRLEAQIREILSLEELPLKLKSRAMYVIGIANCYQQPRYNDAMLRFREAVDYAVQTGEKALLAPPLYGSATVLYAQGRYAEALKELDRLDILLSCLQVYEIEAAARLLRALILRNQGLFTEALDAAWLAYESLKHHPNLVVYLHTLCALGSIYLKKNDPVSAEIYYNLANRSLKRSELPRVARLVDEGLTTLGVFDGPKADLSFDTRTGVLIEKNRGEIRFEGQFVLRDLLYVFLRNPGQVFTKDELVMHVWHETYTPENHDNKIYVTIKRLRKLLESPNGTTDYILRAKAGYFLNPKVRVMIDDKVVETNGSEASSHSRLASSESV